MPKSRAQQLVRRHITETCPKDVARVALSLLKQDSPMPAPQTLRVRRMVTPHETYLVTTTRACGGFGKIRRAMRISDGMMLALKEVRTGEVACSTHRTGLSSKEGTQHEIAMAAVVSSPLRPTEVIFYRTRNSEKCAILMRSMVCNARDLLTGRREQAPTALYRSLLQQIGAALAVMHGQRVRHNDVKPENILVDEYGTLLLGDLGAAEPQESNCGGFTRGYVAPEAHEGSRCLASDVFALALAAASLASGLAPPLNDKAGAAKFTAWYHALPRITPEQIDVEEWKKSDALLDRFFLALINKLPADVDRLMNMVHPDPDQRMTAAAVSLHFKSWSNSDDVEVKSFCAASEEVASRSAEEAILRAHAHVSRLTNRPKC